eukprot:TRINITY_DN17627_c0_g1_i2.p1 TRINITY_DN17627_c0_g1~~TRINITY_DN17627_c0_g1_i2.p1  ORF type:complete len:296 (+),score=25.91 TRINITY_DN17627_c0_g1_i2:191-1078(+)
MRPLIIRNSQMKTLSNVKRLKKTFKLKNELLKKPNAYTINYANSKNNLTLPRVANLLKHEYNTQEDYNHSAKRCSNQVVNLVAEDNLMAGVKIKEEAIEPLVNNTIKVLKEPEDILNNNKEMNESEEKIEFPVVGINVQRESDFSVLHKPKAASLNCRADLTLSRGESSGVLALENSGKSSHKRSIDNESSHKVVEFDKGNGEENSMSKNYESKKSDSSENILRESRSSAIYLAQRKGEVEDSNRNEVPIENPSNKEDSKSVLSNLSYGFINLSLIHICRCRRYAVCRSRWSPYH